MRLTKEMMRAEGQKVYDKFGMKAKLDFLAGAEWAMEHYEEAPQNLPKLCEVTELIIDAVNIDGAHHKQWYLEQIAVKLGIELPEHEKGIIP